MVCCSHNSPTAVANVDDTTAHITLTDTSFVSNNHTGVACYDWHGGMMGYSWRYSRCFVPNEAAGAAGLTTVSNVCYLQWCHPFCGQHMGRVAQQVRGRCNPVLLMMNSIQPA
jgi:hypothetical protein